MRAVKASPISRGPRPGCVGAGLKPKPGRSTATTWKEGEEGEVVLGGRVGERVDDVLPFEGGAGPAVEEE